MLKASEFHFAQKPPNGVGAGVGHHLVTMWVLSHPQGHTSRLLVPLGQGHGPPQSSEIAVCRLFSGA